MVQLGENILGFLQVEEIWHLFAICQIMRHFEVIFARSSCSPLSLQGFSQSSTEFIKKVLSQQILQGSLWEFLVQISISQSITMHNYNTIYERQIILLMKSSFSNSSHHYCLGWLSKLLGPHDLKTWTDMAIANSKKPFIPFSIV